MGISLRSLAAAMDISIASLFGYRNGTIQISTKAWGKLEQAERAAELARMSKNMPMPTGENRVCEDTPPYRVRAKPESTIDPELLGLLSRIADALESLAKSITPPEK